MITCRMANSADLVRIENKLRNEDIVVPKLNEDTFVALDEEDNLVAFVGVRNIPFMYVHMNEDLEGHRAAWALEEFAEIMLKSRGFREIFVGVDEGVQKMVKVAKRFDFQTFGETLYVKYLSPVLKKVEIGRRKRLE
jgi:hypothetical protein